MSLQSMTGFARSSALHGETSIAWELKSVNGKSADARLRLPQGFDRLEQPARKAIQQRFNRGNVFASLTVEHGNAIVTPVVNEDFLKDVAGLSQRLEQQYGCQPASADGLLALRGVLEQPGATDDKEAAAALDAAVLECLEQTLSDLESARKDEGSALVAILLDHVSRIEQLTADAETDPSREPASIRERLKLQIAPLLEDTSLDEDRLYQEAVFLASKADICEEIDRLKAHVASARKLLDGDKPVGRKLDFLAQEFNRESNTLCSKSNAAAVTSIGLELKAVVDQFREQVQNLE